MLCQSARADPRVHVLNFPAQSRLIPINITDALSLQIPKRIVGARMLTPSWGVKFQVIC
jgi:hypothetical protein